jgi:formylmethanofuran dehydrogenase subunit A
VVNILVSEGYNKGRLNLERLVEVLSKNAAVHYGLYPKKGAMNIGSDADLTIVDLKKAWTIDKDISFMKNKYTPLHGLKLTGKVVKTIVRGTMVYKEEPNETKGTILVEPGFGNYVKRQSVQELPRKIRYEHYRAIGADYFNNVHRRNVNNVID